MKKIRQRLTYANVMSSIAVFLVLGGASAVAANQLAKNSVGSKQLKKNAVVTAKIKANAVTTAKIKNGAVASGKIKDGAVNGAKVLDGSLSGADINLSTLGTVPSASSAGVASTLAGYSRKGILRATPTAGPSSEVARSAAPELALFSSGPFTVYAKCISYPGSVEGLIFIKTSESGSILDSDYDEFSGDPFLDVGTPEIDAQMLTESAGSNSAGYYGNHSPEFSAMAPNGTVLRGDVQIGVKNGELAGGNGLYGAGDACLFAGEATALNG